MRLRFNSSTTTLLMSGALFAFGCAGAEAGPAPELGALEQATERADSSASGEKCSGKTHGKRHGKHARHGGAGSERMIHAALGLNDLTDGQRTELEALRSQSRPEREGAREGRQEQRTAMIAAVRAGDVEALRALHQGREGSADKTERRAAVLNGVHGILTASQRQALADAMRARIAARGERGGREGRTESAGERHHGKRQGGKRGGGERFLRGLDLTDEQRAALDAARPERTGSHVERSAARTARMDTLLTAFVAEDFDATTLPSPEAHGSERGGHHGAGLARLLPILTAEQRERLAVSMEQHGADKGGWKKRGGGKLGKSHRNDDSANE